ncbi:MAG: site-2 protease family protein [Oscillospiraceae bacterium]|nr:site-2 protease family protein [Oscillospiraceae bacterium]
MNTFLSIIIALFMFGVLIFVHELGHYLSAKWAGMKVNEFAMGMGPVIFRFIRGETQYAIRLFPIGGFVAVEGDGEIGSGERPASAPATPGGGGGKAGVAFYDAKLSKRFVFVLAGSLMNLILGFLIASYLTAQQPMFSSNVVADFAPNAITNQHLEVDDEITRINGRRVRTGNDLMYELSRSRDGVMDIEVLRAGQRVRLSGVQFKMEAVEGINFIRRDFLVYGIRPTFANTIDQSFNRTVFYARFVASSLIDLVTGRYGLNQVSGPVGITQQIGEVVSEASATRSWDYLFEIIALISINLAIFNMLPIPALDGGRMMFLAIELVRGKPVAPKYEGYVHAAGFVLLIGLMIVITFSDIAKLITGG